MSPELLPLLLAAPLFALMALGDLRRLRIPNLLVAGLAMVFAASAPFALTGSEAGFRLVAAGAVFALTFACFAAGLMAGGDVKALTVTMLFVPAGALSLFGLAFSASLLAGIALVLVLRRLAPGRPRGWHGLVPGGGYPMGLSIGSAALALLVLSAAIGGRP